MYGIYHERFLVTNMTWLHDYTRFIHNTVGYLILSVITLFPNYILNEF